MADATPNLASSKCSIRTVTGWTIFFMVLLRVAIGWHMVYEGLWKLSEEHKSRWTATGYLVASSGPLRPLFQKLVEDPNGLERLSKENILARMDAQAERATKYYQLDAQQAKVFRDFVDRKKNGLKDDNNVKRLFGFDGFKKEIAAYRLALIKGEAADPKPILAQVERILDDLDATVVSAYKERLKSLAEEVAKAPASGDEPGLKGAAAKEELLKILAAKGEPPARESLVPAKVSQPDDLSWLTERYLNWAPDDKPESGFLGRRYDQLKAWCMFNAELQWDPGDKFARSVRGLVQDGLFENHQSAKGWRYRDQKKIGADRDPGYVEAIWNNPDFQQQIKDYKLFLDEVVQADKNKAESGESGKFHQQRLLYDYGKKAAARQALLARLEGPLNDLDPSKMETFKEQFGLKLTDKQAARGPLPLEPRTLKQIVVDYGNMIGLTVAGAFLMIGLFTRFSALSGACLIGLYYMAMPPWPGLPETPMSEGHYLIVNKNLVEIIALLMIATSGAGKWCGLDAFISAIIRRSRCKTATVAS